MLLAGACAGPAQSRARLDRQVRLGAERLAKAGSGVSRVTKMRITREFLPGVAPVAAMLVATTMLTAAAPVKLTGGNGMLYVGGWPNKIFAIDEASEKVAGTIEVASGVPTRMVMSKDRKRFYLVNSLAEQVEIIDVAGRKSIDHFTLSEGRKKVRIRSLTPDPLDRFVIMLVKAAEKNVDRFEISPPSLVVYDLKTHAVSRTIPWPNNEEREFVNLMMSPDGKLLYFFADDVLIYDTTEFKQVDKWELSRPLEEGLGRL